MVRDFTDEEVAAIAEAMEDVKAIESMLEVALKIPQLFNVPWRYPTTEAHTHPVQPAQPVGKRAKLSPVEAPGLHHVIDPQQSEVEDKVLDAQWTKLDKERVLLERKGQAVERQAAKDRLLVQAKDEAKVLSQRVLELEARLQAETASRQGLKKALSQAEESHQAALAAAAAAAEEGIERERRALQGRLSSMELEVKRLKSAHQAERMSHEQASKQDARDRTTLQLQLRNTIAQVLHVEESLASNVTCLTCMEPFQAPVTIIPCGHTYCRSCLASSGGLCGECGSDRPAVTTILNVPLDAVASKYEVKLAALRSIQRALASDAAARPPARM